MWLNLLNQLHKVSWRIESMQTKYTYSFASRRPIHFGMTNQQDSSRNHLGYLEHLALWMELYWLCEFADYRFGLCNLRGLTTYSEGYGVPDSHFEIRLCLMLSIACWSNSRLRIAWWASVNAVITRLGSNGLGPLSFSEYQINLRYFYH